MSQEKKKREEVPALDDESPPQAGTVEEDVAVGEPDTTPPPKPQKTKPAPAETSMTLILVGAASYSNLCLGLGPFRKGHPFKMEVGKAEALLETGLFEKV